MTSFFNPRTPINDAFDLIDKHVKPTASKMQIHYDKAAETRALLKRLGFWPEEKRKRGTPPRRKQGMTVSEKAAIAYKWAVKNDKTTMDAAEYFGIGADAIHSYRQYRKLPKLRK